MEKTRFSFSEKECILSETIENPDIIMYWEKKRELCPHCKEIIVRGEHVSFTVVELWIPFDLKEENCTMKDIVALGKNSAGVSLMLTQDLIKKVLTKSQKYARMVTQ